MGENDSLWDIREQRDYKVVKANEIIQKARYDLSIMELRALAFIFSKIKPTDTELVEYTFSIQDYCQVYGINKESGTNYKAVKDSLQSLRDKSFWMVDENGKEVLIGWLQKVRINKGSGKVEVKLDDDLQKYVIGLCNNFTQYELLYTMPLKSNYSFRIYELLKSYAFTKHHVFDTDELRHQLAAEKYVNFKDFRKRVIEVAVKEINMFTDLDITWQPIFKGRKAIQVEFFIEQKDQWGRLEAYGKATEEIEGQMNIEDFLNGR